jgi:AcrR family transcriptional regulator
MSGQDMRRRELAATSDARVQQTRHRIVTALNEVLTEHRPVSVAAVCTRAGIGRSTFYTHFATVGDVVAHVVDTMFDELARRDVERRTEHSMPRTAITRLGMHELLEAVTERKHFFLYALSAPTTERVREHLVQEMAQSLRGTILAERPDASALYLGTVAEYIAGGVVGILLGYVEDPRGRDADMLTNILVELLPSWLAGDL